MCNCHKKKKRPDGSGPATFTKASVLDEENPILTEKVGLNFLSHLSDPVTVSIPNGRGGKKVLSLSGKDRVPRQLKMKVMQAAPRLFSPDDPDWQYAGEDERVNDLFQKVNANV